MKWNLGIFCSILFLISGVSLSQNNFQSVPDDQYWSGLFANPGLFNKAQVVTNYNSTTVVFAGNFELPADSGGFDGYLLAFWDGTGWTIKAPGSINLFNNESIYCICAVGTEVFIGGNFTTLNSKPISYLAKWDGNEWSEVGGGVNAPVRALATDGNFNIYVGGEFTRVGDTTANHIAKWDGFEWTRLEEQGGLTDGVNNIVRTIAFSGNGIYVGGDFTIAGGTIAYFAAKYNSLGSWEDVGVEWTVGSVSSIAVAVDHVYLGGAFFTATGWPSNGIVRNDGAGGWEAFGNGSSVGVQKLLVNASGFVYALGDFSADAGPSANQIAMWDGASWHALGNEPFTTGQVVDIALLELNTIYTTKFTFQDQNYLLGNGVYKWDGSSWSGVGFGIGDYWTTVYSVNSLAWYNSKLIAGGLFTTAGDKFISGLAQFDGTSWTNVGDDSTSSIFYINDLLVKDNKLYAGGNFTNIGGTNANNIAVWDGNSWSALGSGVDASVAVTHSIGNDLYVSGSFFNAGGSPAIGYAKWNGSTWSSLGSGGPSCFAMTNIGSDLYVGGQISSINGGTLLVHHLARWDGTTWYDVGGGVSDGSNFTTSINALAVMGTKLVVGGNFTVAGSVSANNIAVWDGSQWSALGDGLNGIVRTIFVSGTDIYAGGQFTMSGNNLIYSIAKWDGSTWHPLGSGIHQSNNFVSTATVNDLLPTENGLYVGGQFTHAGDKYSNMVALYTNFTTDVKKENNSIPENFSLEQNYPNPFNPSTKIKYSIAPPNLPKGEASVGTSFMKFVKLKVYDILGNEIATLVNQEQPAGNYELEFNAGKFPSGVYFYRLQAGSYTKTMKMLLLK